MSTRPVQTDPALAAAVKRARESFDLAGELAPRPGPIVSSLTTQERAAVARILRDGTYRQLADAVAQDDPELSDQ